MDDYLGLRKKEERKMKGFIQDGEGFFRKNGTLLKAAGYAALGLTAFGIVLNAETNRILDDAHNRMSEMASIEYKIALSEDGEGIYVGQQILTFFDPLTGERMSELPLVTLDSLFEGQDDEVVLTCDPTLPYREMADTMWEEGEKELFYAVSPADAEMVKECIRRVNKSRADEMNRNSSEAIDAVRDALSGED